MRPSTNMVQLVYVLKTKCGEKVENFQGYIFQFVCIIFRLTAEGVEKNAKPKWKQNERKLDTFFVMPQTQPYFRKKEI